MIDAQGGNEYRTGFQQGIVKILDSTFVKGNLEQVAANSTHLNAEKRSQPIALLNKFEGMFDVTPGDRDTDPFALISRPIIYCLIVNTTRSLGLTRIPFAKILNT